jgi:YidC/Oxa1 family membrane protein insertase
VPAAPAVAAPPVVETALVPFANGLINGQLTNQFGGSVLRWDLLNFYQSTADQKKAASERERVNLAPYQRVHLPKKHPPRNFSDQAQLVCALHNLPGLDGAQTWQLVEQAPDHVTMSQTAGAVTVTKTLRFRRAGDQPTDLPYNVDVEMDIANAGAQAAQVQPFCAVYEQLIDDTSSFFYREYNQMLQVNNIEGSLEANPIAKVEADDIAQAPTFWTGFADNYFAAIVGPDQDTLGVQDARAQIRPVGQNLLEARLVAEALTVDAQKSRRVVFKAYLGPKQREYIAAGENGPKYHFDRSIDFGWFDVIAQGLMVVLIFFAKLTRNYGVAILIVTVIVKILLFPLQHKSFKSMKAMAKLQPEVAKLREKYKGNNEKLNQEMMALYKVHKVNPAGGCLPILLQLPIFIAFYRALGYSIELRHTPFFGWLQDLSAQDPYYITPLLMGVTMFVSQKLTPTSADPAQNKVMQIMPVLFTFLFLSFPSGLVLYWLTNNVLSIVQQVITNKFLLRDEMPAPVKVGGKSAND